MLAFGLVMVNLIDDPNQRFDLYQAHKSLGVLVFVLMIGRIVTRLGNAAPAPIATMPLWRRRAAASAHVLLYGLTIASSLAGYAMVSASPLPLPVALPFGVNFPNLLAPDHDLSERFKRIHHALAAILALCVAMHVAAALKHQFLDRDGTLRGMGLF